MLCVAELNNESFLPKVVEAIVGMVLDNAKPKEKELLIKLLVALRTKEAIGEAPLEQGLAAFTDQLEDLAIDVPLAPQLLGEAVAAVIMEGAHTYALLKTLTSKMEGCEVMRKFLSVILLKLRTQGGEPALKKKLEEHAIDLEEVLKADPEFDPPDLPTVKQFLFSKGLRELV